METWLEREKQRERERDTPSVVQVSGLCGPVTVSVQTLNYFHLLSLPGPKGAAKSGQYLGHKSVRACVHVICD